MLRFFRVYSGLTTEDCAESPDHAKIRVQRRADFHISDISQHHDQIVYAMPVLYTQITMVAVL